MFLFSFLNQCFVYILLTFWNDSINMVLNNYVMVTGNTFKTGNEKSGRILKFTNKI